VSLCPLAAQAFPKPKDVSSHRPQESLFGVIMPVPQTLIPRPMHAFGPWRKSVEKAWIASKPLSDFLRSNLMPDPRCRLPRGIGEPGSNADTAMVDPETNGAFRRCGHSHRQNRIVAPQSARRREPCGGSDGGAGSTHRPNGEAQCLQQRLCRAISTNYARAGPHSLPVVVCQPRSPWLALLSDAHRRPTDP